MATVNARQSVDTMGLKGLAFIKVKNGDAVPEGDTVADGSADFAVRVGGVTKLTGGDFEL